MISLGSLGFEVPPTAGLPLSFADLLPTGNSDFASEAKSFLNVPYAGLECSGTACLVVMLTALKKRSTRRTVLIPAFTCPLVPLAIAHCGLKVRLCDLAPDSLDLDAQDLLKQCDHDTLAILPTHLAGRVSDIGAVVSIADSVGAYVIEDAAQAFGASRNGQSVGLNGDAGFFSFAVGKGLTLYEGGLWVTKNAALAADFIETSKAMIRSANFRELVRSIELLAYSLLYRPRFLGLVYGAPLRNALKKGNVEEALGDVFSPRIPLHRVGRWRSSVGSTALKRMPTFLASLAAAALQRSADLAQIRGIRVVDDAPGAKGVWPSLMLLMPSPESRDGVLKELWEAGVGVTRMFANALPDYAYLRSCVPPTACANARNFAARSLTISNSPWLDDTHFNHILGVLKRHVQ